MQRGTAAGSPNSSASPGSGRGGKHGMSLPAPSGPVRSVWSPVFGAVTSRTSSLGTIGRSSEVVNTTGLLGLAARGRHLGTRGQVHGLRLRRGEPEVDLGPGRGRREQA